MRVTVRYARWDGPGRQFTVVSTAPGTTVVAVPDDVPDPVASPAGCATATVAAAVAAAGGRPRSGEHLDAVVCASDVPTGRPAPDMIHRAMALTGVDDPATVLAAGDTALDVRAGRAARAALVVGVLSGAQNRIELEREHPTHIVPSLRDLPRLVGL